MLEPQIRGHSLHKYTPVGSEVDKLHIFGEGAQVLERILNFLVAQPHDVRLVDDFKDGITSGRLKEKVIDVCHLCNPDVAAAEGAEPPVLTVVCSIGLLQATDLHWELPLDIFFLR